MNFKKNTRFAHFYSVDFEQEEDQYFLTREVLDKTLII